MSIFAELADALAPSSSAEDKQKARARAQQIAKPGDWFSMIIDHHLKLEDAFAVVKATNDEAGRRDAQKKLGIILTGHANAEESVIYPAMVESGEDRHALHGYTEQAQVKIDMASLGALPAMSQSYNDKLEAIREAVAHHMFEEEGTWYPDLAKSASTTEQAELTKKYSEEYNRYVGT